MQQVRDRQHDLCECGQKLGDNPEKDHLRYLARWGIDTIDNIELNCEVCHLAKTEQERLCGISRYNPLASVMSRDLLEQFVMAPMPPQLCVGHVTEGDPG